MEKWKLLMANNLITIGQIEVKKSINRLPLYVFWAQFRLYKRSAKSIKD